MKKAILTTILASCLLANCSLYNFIKRDKVMNGFNYADYCVQPSVPFDEEVYKMKELGANSVAIVPTHYIDNMMSANIDTVGFPKLDEIVLAIKCAKKQKLKIILKPHIDVKDGSSRTNIEFYSEKDWKELFESYEKILDKYFDVAKKEKVDIFCIGTELELTVGRPEWLDIINHARKRFEGKITFATNDYKCVPFWNKLDYIGVDFYPYIKVNEIKEDIIGAKLSRALDSLGFFREEIKKPVLITEWGYRFKCPGNEKWGWLTDQEPNKEEQAMYYNAFAKALKEKDFISGYFLWVWHPKNGYQDKFCPRDNPAEEVISDFFKN